MIKLVQNPYEHVDWRRFGQHRANLHTHTTVTDGCPHPHQVIDMYYSGSSLHCCEWEFRETQCAYYGSHVLAIGRRTPILAITDHDRPARPWRNMAEDTRRMEYRGPCVDEPRQNRDPAALGMIEIPGCEFSCLEHIVSLYSDAADSTDDDYDSMLTRIEDKDGLAFWAHPAKYRLPEDSDFYCDYYRRYPCLLGQGIFNKGSGDGEIALAIWDQVLMGLMPERPVWGFSNDDLHHGKHLFRNYNTVVVEELTDSSVRTALTNGCFYFSYSDHWVAPSIEAIHVDDTIQTIRISGTGCDEIRWISQGQVIATGACFTYGRCRGLGAYVRAELEGDGITCTQPFGFSS